ncbi:hypothetical protein EDB85DRAFT_1894486 [Lactarius pseudohatsudake]|nr:hypothetical protein EDB85DRAFT_1894486 [Lactarius pseudohatsudake]
MSQYKSRFELVQTSFVAFANLIWTSYNDNSRANEDGKAGSSSTLNSQQKEKAAKEQSRGQESDVKALHAWSKSRKQVTSGGPSNVKVTEIGQTTGITVVRPLVGAEDNGKHMHVYHLTPKMMKDLLANLHDRGGASQNIHWKTRHQQVDMLLPGIAQLSACAPAGKQHKLDKLAS